MAEGRVEHDDQLLWSQTSAIVATLLNVNRDPKKGRLVSPEELNPYAGNRRRRSKRVADEKDLQLLREVFGGSKK